MIIEVRKYQFDALLRTLQESLLAYVLLIKVLLLQVWLDVLVLRIKVVHVLSENGR